jgi:hypothetical protein
MNDQYIWDYLNSYIQNDIGTAALMGNLQAESGLVSYRLQGDFTSGYMKSKNYTNAVDNGSYTETQFVNDQKGYGLAQWTYYTRKQKLYDKMQEMGLSIGAVELGCAYLLEELQADYSSVWAALVSATSIRAASDVVLIQFENPADQSEAVQIHRAQLSQAIYDEFSGQPIPPTPPTPPSPDPSIVPSIPLWMLFKFSKG